MGAFIQPLIESLQPKNIIPPGSQSPSPQMIQQGVQQAAPSKPLAQTDPGTNVPVLGGSLMELIAQLGKNGKA